MKRFLAILLLAWTTTSARAVPQEPTSFIDEHAELKKYLFQEPKSPFHIAFGISPISILSNRILFSLSVFQLHAMTRWLDFEIISASFGFGLGKDSLTGSRQVLLRSVPKIRLGSFFSVGPMIGMEYVSFPNVNSKIYKGTLFTPQFEPFSQSSYVYGVVASETFQLGAGYILKINESVYKETYSPLTTSNGWNFYFDDPGLQNDVSPLNPSLVVAIEFSLLF